MAHSSAIDDLRNRAPAEWLRERDIDLLICCELWAEASPLHALLAGQWNHDPATFDGAWVSHRGADGDTDIVVSFTSNRKRLVLPVENKIDAHFRPSQPERYRQLAIDWKHLSGPSVDVDTVLLAPAEYLDSQGSDLFDHHLSYEELVDSLSEAVDPRSRFLAHMLREGINATGRATCPLPMRPTPAYGKPFTTLRVKRPHSYR